MIWMMSYHQGAFFPSLYAVQVSLVHRSLSRAILADVTNPISPPVSLSVVL